jgi:hypothetical protein
MLAFIAALLPLLPPSRRVPAAPDFADTALLRAEDDAPAGCGWFESSHELQSGLQVTEHASADTVAEQLPLNDWLALHLSGWSAAPCAS